jgi:hypothetical protein
MHSFYMLSSALMLFWYLRYEVSKRRRGSAGQREGWFMVQPVEGRDHGGVGDPGLLEDFTPIRIPAH